jgi:16S rRNA processing protein RimM
LSTDAGEWLRAGAVGAPHGLDGSFHVTRPSASLLVLGADVSVGGRPATIERRAGTDARPILRVSGCSDRDGALALRGQPVLAPRASAPLLEDDEWWPEDLEGCSVWALGDSRAPLGIVRRLRALPSCEVLEVARTAGGSDLLVPLVHDAVRSVDVAGRRIEVDVAFLGEE